jgi:UDP-glucose 4-epimerase
MSRPSDVPAPVHTVVVTGGAGFIGSHLVDALLAECRAGRLPQDLHVRVVDDLSTGSVANLAGALAEGDVGGRPPVTLVRCSILDPLEEVLAGADVVFHLAASVFPARSVAEPRADAEVNIMGTLNLLEACRRTGVRRVIYSSSAAVYGDPQELPVPETHPPAPISPYGLSKYAAEQYCLLYAQLFGLRVTALRYFTVYGSRQSPESPYSGVISRFADRARRGEPLEIYGDGSQTRDFVHVSDVVRANLCALYHCAAGVYNIGTGRAVSVEELARLVAQITAALTGRPPVSVQYLPARPGDIRHSIACVARAARTLGFRAAVSLEKGLRALLQELVGSSGSSGETSA